MRVFHAAGPWEAGERLRLDTDESRYLLKVRRARVGTELQVLDGRSACWDASLVEVQDRTAIVQLTSQHSTGAVMPLELLLVVPEPRATLESITQACELGATQIALIRGDHSPGGVPSAERIAKTIRAAQRQCGRPAPPTISGPLTLEAALQLSTTRPGVVASLRSPHSRPSADITRESGARVLIGPEGGLSAAEEDQAAAAGLTPIRLGPWVLRTPTAVVAALARLVEATEAAPVDSATD